jgi:hypothetical protein
LVKELSMEMERMGVRNLGRDDRAVSDSGKELRCPFLDEAVVRYLKALPVDLKCDLSLSPGVGDKRLLRVAAEELFYSGGSRHQVPDTAVTTAMPPPPPPPTTTTKAPPACASLAKRAIQFGSRIAKLSNLDHFGSNRKGRGDAAY